jgi:uncharacterized alkaline shock family protein YloU
LYTTNKHKANYGNEVIDTFSSIKGKTINRVGGLKLDKKIIYINCQDEISINNEEPNQKINTRVHCIVDYGYTPK